MDGDTSPYIVMGAEQPKLNSGMDWKTKIGYALLAVVVVICLYLLFNFVTSESTPETVSEPSSEVASPEVAATIVPTIVNANVVCGTDASGGIYCSDPADPLNPTWFKVDGSLADVSVNEDGSLYGVNGNGNIYYNASYKTNVWKMLPGALSKISSHKGLVCGLNGNGQTFCSDTTNPLEPVWNQQPGGLSDISVNKDGSLYGVSGGYGIFYKASYKTGDWIKVAESLPQISSSNGVLCGTKDKKVSCSDSTDPLKPVWTQLSLPELTSEITYVSVNGDGSLYGTDSKQNVYYSKSYKNPTWVKLPGNMRQIASY